MLSAVPAALKICRGVVLPCLGTFLWGCIAQTDIPVPKDHPAHQFYQTANSFYVAGSSCTKIQGSLAVRPDKIGPGLEYEKIKELAPGLMTVREKATGREWVSVIFMEYSMSASIPKTCSWETEKFPIKKI